jgi:hypothetical protein
MVPFKQRTTNSLRSLLHGEFVETPASSADRHKDPWWWIYTLILVAGSLVFLDGSLVPDSLRSQVDHVKTYTVNTSTRSARSSTEWSVVTMEDGSRFQTNRPGSSFPKGTRLTMESGRIFGGVQRYWAEGEDPRSPHDVEASTRDLNMILFSGLSCVLAILLFVPLWSWENRWFLRIALGIAMGAWAISVFATGWLRVLG